MRWAPPSVPAVQVSEDPSTRPVDYLDDEVTSAFFAAREHEAYYRSLHLVEDRRACHDEIRPVLLRLLRLAAEGGFSSLDDLITRTSRDAQRAGAKSFSQNPTERVRRMEPEGIRLLGSDAGLDLASLRSSYRTAARLHHPDRGGSHGEMTSINLAYEQLHRILLEEGDDASSWASAELSSTQAYLWAIRRLLFEIELDEWALDDAVTSLQILAAAKQLCGELRGQRLIELIEPVCKLAKHLCAAGKVETATAALAVAQDGLLLAQERGMTFDVHVRIAAAVVTGIRKPRFFLRDARQIENAFRLGAINQKRYEAEMSRMAGHKDLQELDSAKRDALLAEAKFLPSLPVDARLQPSKVVGSRVPQPGYYEYRSETLSAEQQAEYLLAFRGAADLKLVSKYAFVRLSGLLRSAIFAGGSANLQSMLAEVQLLANVRPLCACSADGVAEVIRFLAALAGSKRALYASALAKLLEPESKSMGGFTITLGGTGELAPTFFNAARELTAKFGSG